MSGQQRDRAEVCQWLVSFVRGDDRSKAFAWKLEVGLDDAFPDDDECQDLVLALAMYQPGGGDYLYDEAAIVPMCRRVLNRVCPDCRTANESP